MSLRHWPPPPAGNNMDVFNAFVPRAHTNTPVQKKKTFSQAQVVHILPLGFHLNLR